MIQPPKVPPYKCIYHKWEKWHHYGCPMPENGCRLSKNRFACKVYDAIKCPSYKPKE